MVVVLVGIQRLFYFDLVKVHHFLYPSRTSGKGGDVARRRMTEWWLFPPPPESFPPTTPSPSPLVPEPPPPPPATSTSPSVVPTPAEAPSAPQASSSGNQKLYLIVSASAGGGLLLLLITGIYFWRSGKVSTVKPWATGLSGQLQRAFVTGKSDFYASTFFRSIFFLRYRRIPFLCVCAC